MNLESIKQDVRVLGDSFAASRNASYMDIAELVVHRKSVYQDFNGGVTERVQKERFVAYVKGVIIHCETPFLCYTRSMDPDNHVQGVSIDAIDDVVAYASLKKL